MRHFSKLGFFLLYVFLGSSLQGQDIAIDIDSLTNAPDSLPISDDRLTKISFSKDSFETEVKYVAADSQWLDSKNRFVYLYGDASVEFQTYLLKANYIRIDMKNSIAFASGYPDSSGTIAGKPIFQDGSETFDSDSIRFNFETKRGMVYQVKTIYDDVYIHGTRTKFLADTSTNIVDSLKEDVIYNYNGLFTTCELDHPHFGIRSKKQKIIPNKLVVVGPSYLELAGVKTPLWLPFGFFPISNTKKSGLIIPRDYEYSPQWGYGIRNIGYYVPLGDHMGLRVTGDIYTRGSWGIDVSSDYRKRYKYNGNFSLAFSNRISEVRGVFQPDKSLSLRWRHSQDQRAHPYRNISGNINIQTNGFQQKNFNDANSVLQNSLTSNLSYRRSFPGKPYSISANLGHSQNTRTQRINITLPTMNFQMRRIFPFKRKKAVGKQKFYEKISFKYDANLQNVINTTDSTLFSQATLDNAKYGMQHKMSTNFNFKLGDLIPIRALNFINITPAFNYTELWNFSTIEKRLLNEYEIEMDTVYNIDSTQIISIRADTLSYGIQQTDTIKGFKPARTYTFSVNMQTALFGQINFKKGRLKGIRHVMKPSVSFQYSPDYTSENLGYNRMVDTDLREFYNNPQLYNIFANSAYSSVPRTGRRAGLAFSITNIFEAKYLSKKDSLEKKLKLFDNISLSSFYNAAADSMRWSDMSMRGTTRFFKGMTTVSTNANFTPYVVENGRRTSTYLWEKNRKIVSLNTFTLSMSTSLQMSKVKEWFVKKKDKDEEGDEEEEVIEDESSSDATFSDDLNNPLGKNLNDRGEYVQERPEVPKSKTESFFDLFQNFRVYHNFVYSLKRDNDGNLESVISANSINTQGNIQMTPNWSIRVGNIGYDFISKRISYPDFGFQRDLHCWEMSFNWQPVRGTYSFMIRVKGSTLNFIKIPYNKNLPDAIPGF